MRVMTRAAWDPANRDDIDIYKYLMYKRKSREVTRDTEGCIIVANNTITIITLYFYFAFCFMFGIIPCICRQVSDIAWISVL